VQGSLPEKHRLNIVLKPLIAVGERRCGRLFWLNINRRAIHVKANSRILAASLCVVPDTGGGSLAECRPLLMASV
jgi:hypothetical protein